MSAIDPMATSATCESTRVSITPGTACLVMIGHSQAEKFSQVAAASRSAFRSGVGMMSWVRKRVRLASAEPPPMVSGSTSTLAMIRNGTVDGRAHRRRVPMRT